MSFVSQRVDMVELALTGVVAAVSVLANAWNTERAADAAAREAAREREADKAAHEALQTALQRWLDDFRHGMQRIDALAEGIV